MTNDSDHTLWAERLSEYLDGELPDADARQLEAHLVRCATCQSALQDLQRVVSRLHSARVPSSPETTSLLWPGVVRQLAPRDPMGLRATEDALRWPRRLLAGGLLMSVGAAGGWWVGAARCDHSMGWPARLGVHQPAVETLRVALSRMARGDR